MTGSSPRGHSGPSPRYSCIHCRVSVLGKKVSTPRQQVHDEFLAILDDVRPSEGVSKLFKDIVLKKWNAEFKDAIEHSSKIDTELSAWQSKKSRILDLYIENNPTDAEKRQKWTRRTVRLPSLSCSALMPTNTYAIERILLMPRCSSWMTHQPFEI